MTDFPIVQYKSNKIIIIIIIVSSSAISFIPFLLSGSGKLFWFKLSLCSGTLSFVILIFDSASSSLLAKSSSRAGVCLASVVKNAGKNSFNFSVVLWKKDGPFYSSKTQFKIGSLIKTSQERKKAEITTWSDLPLPVLNMPKIISSLPTKTIWT